MNPPKILARDPRTVARDMPGILDTLFPQLAPGIVACFNRRAYAVVDCNALSADLIAESTLQHAMLFEIAVAAGQQLVEGGEFVDLDRALKVAIDRQQRHFDAKIPERLTLTDRTIATRVAENLATMLQKLRAIAGKAALVCSPHIPGYQWLASGVGDFAIGSRLVEIKCTGKSFSSSDYRQVMMYWLLSYASSVEGRGTEWSNAVLMNPRLNKVVEVSFDEMIKVTGAGRSKVDVLELFSSMVTDHNNRLLGQM